MESFKKQKKVIDELIDEFLELKPGFKHLEAARYSILPEGKRYRTIISIEIYKLLGGSVENYKEAIVGLELLHHSSLIFDDLPAMDDSPLRKGKKTVHLEFGESNALLAAIYLQEKGRKLLNESIRKHIKSTEEIEEVDTLINKATNNLLLGQEIDLRQEKTDKELLTSMELKNSMFYLSVVLPAYLLEKKDDIRVFDNIGSNISIAYQLFDDLRDLESEDITGKLGGVDKYKNTSVYRFSSDKTHEMLDKHLVEVNQQLNNLNNTENLKNVINYIFTKPS